jgi:hypothetical protein
MENNAMSKRMLKGRPRMRWLDDDESDLKMKVKGWFNMYKRKKMLSIRMC